MGHGRKPHRQPLSTGRQLCSVRSDRFAFSGQLSVWKSVLFFDAGSHKLSLESPACRGYAYISNIQARRALYYLKRLCLVLGASQIYGKCLGETWQCPQCSQQWHTCPAAWAFGLSFEAAIPGVFNLLTRILVEYLPGIRCGRLRMVVAWMQIKNVSSYRWGLARCFQIRCWSNNLSDNLLIDHKKSRYQVLKPKLEYPSFSHWKGPGKWYADYYINIFKFCIRKALHRQVWTHLINPSIPDLCWDKISINHHLNFEKFRWILSFCKPSCPFFRRCFLKYFQSGSSHQWNSMRNVGN